MSSYDFCVGGIKSSTEIPVIKFIRRTFNCGGVR